MFLSIAEDKHIPKLKELTDAIHAEDGKAGIQLWQGGLTVEDTIAFCNWAKDAGVDVLDVSRGNIVTAASKYKVPLLDLPRGRSRSPHWQSCSMPCLPCTSGA